MLLVIVLLFCFPPPSPGRERDAQLGYTPTTTQKGSCMLDGIWCGVVVATYHLNPPQPAERDAQLRHPPHRPERGSLATHPPGLGSSHTRLHPHGAKNEPSPRLSCHYWLSRQSSRQSSVNQYWLRLFCCLAAAGESVVYSVWRVIFNEVPINVWKVCLELLPC